MAERALASMYVNVIPSMKGFNKALDNELVTSGGKTGTKTGDAISGNMKKSVLGGLGGISAAIGSAFAVGAVVNFTSALIKAGEEEMQGNMRIEALVKNIDSLSASSAKVTDRITDQAGKLAVLNGLDDDSIKLAQAKLLAFTDVASSADQVGGVFDRATQAAIDLAASGFGSAEDNAVKLGKALQDPIQYTNALARSGVVLTDAEQGKIAALQESGNLLGAQTALLDILEQKYGGVAAAAAPASAKLAAAWDEVTDAIATALLPTFNEITEVIINEVLPNVVSFIEEFKKGTTPLNDFLNVVKGIFDFIIQNWDWLWKVAAAVLGIVAAFKAFAIVIGVINAVVAIATIIQTGWNLAWLANPITWIILAIIAAIALVIAAIWFLTENWDAVVKFIGEAWTNIVNFFSETFANIGRWFSDMWNGMLNGFKMFGSWIMGILGGIGSFFAGIWNGMVQGFRNAVNWIIGLFEGMINFIIDGINSFLKVLQGGVSFLKKVTGIDIKIGTIQKVNLPRLAKGGYVDQPTTALIGEAGPEVVTPLKDFERMMGLDDKGKKEQTVIYNNYANPGLTSEQELLQAMKRGRIQGVI